MVTSKYFAKTHQEIVYNLDEYQCKFCGHWFMIDIDFCKNHPTKDYDDYARIFCPYCGKPYLMAV